MSQFEVLVSHDPATKGVALIPCVIGTEPIHLGLGQQSLVPIFPEYAGGLVLITAFERQTNDGLYGSGIGQHSNRQYIIPPSRPAPRLQSCWLGRLSPTWLDEPFVEYLTPLVSEESRPIAEKRSLSRTLFSLFTGVWSEKVTLYLGAQDALTTLRMVQAESRTLGRTSALMHRFIPAMLEIGITPAELDSYWPGAEELIERAFKEYESLQTHLEAQLDLARNHLREAEVACGAAQQRRDEGARSLNALTGRYSQWRGPVEQVENP
jgi:hypothetical protein